MSRHLSPSFAVLAAAAAILSAPERLDAG